MVSNFIIGVCWIRKIWYDLEAHFLNGNVFHRLKLGKRVNLYTRYVHYTYTKREILKFNETKESCCYGTIFVGQAEGLEYSHQYYTMAEMVLIFPCR